MENTAGETGKAETSVTAGKSEEEWELWESAMQWCHLSPQRPVLWRILVASAAEDLNSLHNSYGYLTLNISRQLSQRTP